MAITDLIVKFVASRFGIGEDILAYLKAYGKIGQPSEVSIPKELIPSGARLYARGLVNLSFLQPNLDWVLPYWAVRQYDPTSESFLPRGLNLYSLNLTHRNWTSIGNLNRVREAIVDPRGLVTPWFDGWSLDVWLGVDGELYVPSRLPEVEQHLADDLPIVVTSFAAGGIEVTSQVLAAEDDGAEWVLEGVAVRNVSSQAKRASLYLSVRPYNPEGVSLIHHIEFRDNVFYVNGFLAVLLPPPDGVACADLRASDVSLRLPQLDGTTSASCEAGLCTGVVEYRLELAPGEKREFGVAMTLEKGKEGKKGKPLISLSSFSSLKSQVVELWQDKLSRGMRVTLPDPHLQSSFNANKAFLLLLHDGEGITPGPFTYHHFWFRDAAYLVNALDKMGYHAEAKQVLTTYPQRQRQDGFFISQEGEWDANGQAIWTLVEHYKLTGDREFLERVYPSIAKGVEWIELKRRKTKGEPSLHYGLLPPGFSAEHLGPNDYFYWDDFWGAAGEREAAYAAQELGREEDERRFKEAFDGFWRDIEASLAKVSERLGRPLIPASPYRRMDAGAIGSVVALYPLRLLAPHDERLTNTIAALKEKSFVEGVFFHHIDHAAFGTYLNMHIAQCHVFQRSQEAWPIVRWLLAHATPTYTWPEGINPLTRGGGMGDGHHGWAVADWLLLVRNLLLFEEGDRLVLTPALPPEWLVEGNVVRAEDVPTYFGRVSFGLAFGDGQATLELDADFRRPPAYIELNLPVEIAAVDVERAEVRGKAVRLPADCRKAVITYFQYITI